MNTISRRDFVRSAAAIDSAMTNICRCGTYNRVRAAIHRVAQNKPR